MSPKQTALLNVAKLITLSVVIGFFVNAAFTYFTVVEIGIGFCVGMLAFVCKMYYDLALAEAESLESLNKMK
jgi:hypothetical protein